MEHHVSLTTLIKASLAAIVLAAIALVLFILPAEYNIDPTGVGQKLGLTLLAEAAEAAPLAPQPMPDEMTSQQVIEITVPAHKGIEYKLQMNRYDKLTYEWITDGAPLYFDLHGEPEGDTSGYFESYAIATLGAMKGSFTAPFNGSHGWYWNNPGDQPVAIQLIINGRYQIIGLKP
ncbi:MAG: hypothetical protein R3E57_01690 [Porticoccaceae bacterium]